EIVRIEEHPALLGVLAAGLMEDLVVAHGTAMIDAIEAEARRNWRFRQMLGGVWVPSAEPAVAKRLKQATALLESERAEARSRAASKAPGDRAQYSDLILRSIAVAPWRPQCVSKDRCESGASFETVACQRMRPPQDEDSVCGASNGFQP